MRTPAARRHHVVVIGAGPAGLTAAYELTKRDIHPTVIEADSVVGMSERCLELVEKGGGTAILDARVTAVRHELGRAVGIRYQTADGQIRQAPVTSVISTMPLPHLLQAMDPPVPDDVAAAAAGIHYRDFLGEGDELWSMDDDTLVAFGTDKLATLGLVQPERVTAGYVVRMPRACPTYDADYRRNVGIMRRWLDTNAANVFPVGRNGIHRYNNQDHSMYTAMLTVENIADGTNHDVWAVNV